MKLFLVVLSVLQFLIFGCSKEPVLISSKNKKLQYNNRIYFEDGNKAILTWAGSSVTIKFSGTGVKALLQNKQSPSYLNVIIDDDSISIIKSDSTKKWFTLAANLSNGEHTVKIFKRTNNGEVWFYSFQLDKNSKLLKLEKRKRIIEFIGDSITQGSSINDTINDNWRGLNSDNYFTYAAVTARHFNAEYYCIAQGGVGLMVGGNTFVMDDLYYRTNIRDSKMKWDFSKVQPNIVVINLFENDRNMFDHPEHPHFVKKFEKKVPTEMYIINEYMKFVKRIMMNYPKAKIICSLGSMDAAKESYPWFSYVRKAVEKINKPNVYSLLFPYKNTRGHPEVNEHKVMADTLINFINKNNIWNK